MALTSPARDGQWGDKSLFTADPIVSYSLSFCYDPFSICNIISSIVYRCLYYPVYIRVRFIIVVIVHLVSSVNCVFIVIVYLFSVFSVICIFSLMCSERVEAGQACLFILPQEVSLLLLFVTPCLMSRVLR